MIIYYVKERKSYYPATSLALEEIRPTDTSKQHWYFLFTVKDNYLSGLCPGHIFPHQQQSQSMVRFEVWVLVGNSLRINATNQALLT